MAAETTDEPSELESHCSDAPLLNHIDNADVQGPSTKAQPAAYSLLNTEVGGTEAAVAEAVASVAASSTAAIRRPQLPHLTGLRTLVAMWIVIYHYTHVYMEMQPWSAVSAFTGRGAAIPVNFFVLMSGFLTHYCHGHPVALTSSFGSLAQFYARRFGRVLGTSWLAMGVGLMCWMTLAEPRQTLTIGHAVRCFLFAEAWRDPTDWCPNSPTWTIAALLPCWFLYPVTMHHLLALPALQVPRVLIAVSAAVWFIAFLPQFVLFAWQGGQILSSQKGWVMYWPPPYVADFGLGACAASLVVCAPPDSGAWGDTVMGLLFLLCFWLPAPQHGPGWEPLFTHGISPLVAAFLYYSTAKDSRAARLLGSPVFVSLGGYTMQVYLFQNPLRYVFMGLDGNFGIRLPFESAEVCIAFVLSLWLISGVYAETVELAMQKWLRDSTEEWKDKQLHWFLRRNSAPLRREGI